MQKVTQSNAVKYYKSVNSLVSKATQESSQYIVDQVEVGGAIMDSIMKSNLNDSPTKLDTAKLEIFKDRHRRYKSYLDSLLNVLNEIDEIDKTINLKTKAIEYIKHQLEFHNETFQNNLETYSGYTSNSVEDKRSTHSISLEISKDNLDRSRSEIIESSTKYAIKYRLSERELKNNGL